MSKKYIIPELVNSKLSEESILKSFKEFLNSNLKNNYSLVKVQFEDGVIDTDLQFCGSFIGDYARIAIGTNLNTGSYIGIGANIFNHDFKTKYIPSFSWGNNDRVKIELFIDTIIKMKKRRFHKLSLIEENLIKLLYK